MSSSHCECIRLSRLVLERCDKLGRVHLTATKTDDMVGTTDGVESEVSECVVCWRKCRSHVMFVIHTMIKKIALRLMSNAL